MRNWAISAIIVLVAIIGAEWRQVERTNKKWEAAVANMKAYDSQLAVGNEKNLALQLTVGQLGCFRDSVLRELDATRKELRIKDGKLKALQAVRSGFTKRDTITMRDTVFKDRLLAVDTLMGDEWYSVRLGLRYPSMIALQPYFKSEKHIVVSSKKETVNPPKRFFLLRWFQRKHTVVRVDVVEKNPYVDGESSRYVEIIK